LQDNGLAFSIKAKIMFKSRLFSIIALFLCLFAAFHCWSACLAHAEVQNKQSDPCCNSERDSSQNIPEQESHNDKAGNDSHTDCEIETPLTVEKISNTAQSQLQIYDQSPLNLYQGQFFDFIKSRQGYLPNYASSKWQQLHIITLRAANAPPSLHS
jgi:hypothetical protein